MQQLKLLGQIRYFLIVIGCLCSQIGFVQDNVQRKLTVHTVPIQPVTSEQSTNTPVNTSEVTVDVSMSDTTSYVGQDNVARSLTIHSNAVQEDEQLAVEKDVIEQADFDDEIEVNVESQIEIIEIIVASEVGQLFTPVDEELSITTSDINATISSDIPTKLPETTETQVEEITVIQNTGERKLTDHTLTPQEQLLTIPTTMISSKLQNIEPKNSEVPIDELPDVGRLMMVAFEQSDTQTQTILRDIQPGGFAFFPGDIVSTLQIQTLTASLQENSEHPLIFAIDQEGGPFTSYRIDEATLFPGAMMLAATNDTELAKRVGEATAKELNYAGLTMNFAPVADVNSNPDNPIIGIRSFGDNPEKVSAFSQAFAEGSVNAGVASVTKHFPGHGNTTMDSHLELPRIESSLEVMRATDLEPFQNNLNSPALMTAHIVFPALDEVWPATLSHTILTDLLRTDMGYEGLVITDSLVMGALTNSYSAGTIAVKAINAGADMLLVGSSFYEQRLIHDALTEALESGEIPLWRVEEALGRIDNLATSYPTNIDAEVPDYEAHRQLAIEVAKQGTTLVSDSSGVIPFDNSLSVSVIAPKPRGFGTPPHLGNVLAEFMPDVKSIEVSVNPNWSQINNAVAASQNVDVIVLGIYYWLHDFPSLNKQLYNSLKDLGKPVVVVSLGNPNIEPHLGAVPDAHIAAYGYRYSNLYGTSAVVAGEIEAVGTLPIQLQLSSDTE